MANESAGTWERGPESSRGPEIERRKAFLELDGRDAVVLGGAAPSLDAARDAFVERLCAHLGRFVETRALVSDPERLLRLRRGMGAYMARLFAGDYGAAYVLERLRVGVTHHRIGLEPKWYVGAWALFLRTLLPEIRGAVGGDWARAIELIEAVHKVVFLDLGIAIDAYREADRREILRLERTKERILASVPAGLLVVDETLRVVAVNRAFAEACGRPEDALVGKPAAHVVGASGLDDHLRRARAASVPRAGILLAARLGEGDEVRRVRIAIAPLRQAEGEEGDLWLVVVEDVTAEQRLAEAAAAAEVRFREVVEGASDGIVLADGSGAISWFNRAAERMFGWDRDEVRGTPLGRLVPDRWREALERGLGRWAANGESSVIDAVRPREGLRRDGSVFPADWSVGVRRDGESVLVTAIVRDVSSRRRAEERIRLQASALDAVADPVLVTDREGVIVYVNRAFSVVNGWSADEAIGQKPSLLKSGLTPGETYERLWRTILAGKSFSADVVNRRKDGTTYDAELIVAPVLDEEGAVAHFVSTHRPSGRRRRAKAARRDAPPEQGSSGRERG